MKKNKKAICTKKVLYRWTRRGTWLEDVGNDGKSNLCYCEDPKLTACENRNSCRPYKVTYEFIKRIPK